MRTVVIAGASGFIGKPLTQALLDAGYRVRVLKRGVSALKDDYNPDTRIEYALWNPDARRLDPQVLQGAYAVICLSGYSIGARRWTRQVKKLLLSSRLNPLLTLAAAIEELPSDTRPRIFLTASATGYYGNRGNKICTEQTLPGTDLLANICAQIEEKAAKIPIQTVTFLRTGLVFGRGGGMLAQLRIPFLAGLGGRLGSGEQWMPTISVEDHVRAQLFLLDNPCAGPVNIVGAHPVKNINFTRAFAAALHRPAFFALPLWALRFLLGEFGSSVVASQRVLPEVLQRAGFKWKHDECIKQIHAAL